MQRNKYDASEVVCWREILKNMECVLNTRSQVAFNAIWRVNYDRIHNYPENLESDLRRALLACEEVFKQYKLLCSLRRFLKYRPKTAEQLGLSEFHCFYLVNKENPHGADLQAQHHEDLAQQY